MKECSQSRPKQAIYCMRYCQIDRSRRHLNVGLGEPWLWHSFPCSNRLGTTVVTKGWNAVLSGTERLLCSAYTKVVTQWDPDNQYSDGLSAALRSILIFVLLSGHTRFNLVPFLATTRRTRQVVIGGAINHIALSSSSDLTETVSVNDLLSCRGYSAIKFANGGVVRPLDRVAWDDCFRHILLNHDGSTAHVSFDLTALTNGKNDAQTLCSARTSSNPDHAGNGKLSHNRPVVRCQINPKR